MECDTTVPTVTLSVTAGITYTRSGAEAAGGTVVVTATVQDGYSWASVILSGRTIVDASTATYTVEFADAECELGNLVDPIVTDMSCLWGARCFGRRRGRRNRGFRGRRNWCVAGRIGECHCVRGGCRVHERPAREYRRFPGAAIRRKEP